MSRMKEILEHNIVIVFFILLLVIRDFVGVSIPNIVFTAVWALIIVVSPISISASFSLCTSICFASTLSITIPIWIMIVRILFPRMRSFYINPIILVTIFVMLIEGLKFFTYDGQTLDRYLNTMGVAVLVALVIMRLQEDIHMVDVLLKLYVLFSGILTLDIFWATIKHQGSFGSIVSGAIRLGRANIVVEEGNSLLSMNANGIALLALLMMMCVFILKNYEKISIFSFVACTVYSIIIGLLTVSKTYLLVLCVFFALYYLWYCFDQGKSLSKTVIVTIVGLVAAWILVNSPMVGNIMNRFNNDIAKGDITTGRVDVFVEYIDAMRHKSTGANLFGVGLQDITLKMGFSHVPHNAILEIYATLGVIGLILYVIYFCSIFRAAKRVRLCNGIDFSFIQVIPIFVYFIFIQSLQFLRINYIYGSIAIVFACMIANKDNRVDGYD